MKECPRCGKENQDESKFCTGCSFDLRHVDPKGKGNKLKLIGVLIALIIIILGVGLYFTMNNNAHVSSDVNNSDGYTVDEKITSDNVNTDDVEYKTVDFNGFFRMNVPSQCSFSDKSNSRYGANYTWYEYGYYDGFDEIYYFEGFNNTEDVLSQFSISKIETEGNLMVFESHGSINSDDKYYVGIQSNNNELVVLSTTNVNDLDDMKKSANSVVFE